MTPRILPVGNIGHWRSRYTESEKEQIKLEKEGVDKNIFVYIRRSTTNKQELSLQRQDDDARDTIKKNGIDPSKVEYYIESKSAYNHVKVKSGIITRKRTEFTRMLADIDKSKETITILTYEPSRLSRNQVDEMEITERLFWTHEKSKQKIKCVKFNNKDEWSQKTNQWEVRQLLLDCYKESLRTSGRAKDGQIKQLRQKQRYVYSTPRGIDRLKEWEDTLKTNADMLYIRKAWEMKAENKNKREITKYLAKYGIRINSFESYFRNSLYAGEVPDPETWEMLKVKFEWGKPPLSMELFNRVQKTLGIRRVSKHQEGDTLTRLLKWEHNRWKAFTSYYAKGIYKTYKSKALWSFDMSERKILDKILNEILSVLFTVLEEIYYETFGKLFSQEEIDRKITSKEMMEWTIALHEAINALPDEELKKLYKKILFQSEKIGYKLDLLEQWYTLEELKGKKRAELWDMCKNFKDTHKNHFKYICKPEYIILQMKRVRLLRIIDSEFHWISPFHDYYFEQDEKFFNVAHLTREVFKKYLSLHLPIWKKYEETKQEREEQISALSADKDKKEKEIMWIDKEALRKGFSAEVAEELKQDIQKEIEDIDSQISELSDWVDIEKFFERLPEVLAKVFELSTKVLVEEESEVKKEEVYKVIELAVFELNPITKKELKIKLFPVLEAIKKWEKVNWQGRGQTIRTFIENYDMLAEKYGEDF